MVTFKPIAVTEENVTLPYIEGQYITANVPFSDGATTYPKGVWVDLDNKRLKLTMQGEKGEQGEQGVRGSIWFSQATDPVAGNYNPDDMWLNTSSGAVYRYKNGAWELTGNIKGPQGEQGDGFTQQDRDNIERITSATPSTASADNPLATEDFVNSSINNMSAFYITYNANGDAFPTRADLLNATTFYSGGKPRVPTQNDYATVLADESQPVGVDGSYPTTRYTYQTDTQNGTYPNGQWAFQYIVNNTTLTQAQVDAINSGITKELVDKIVTGGATQATIYVGQEHTFRLRNYVGVQIGMSTAQYDLETYYFDVTTSGYSYTCELQVKNLKGTVINTIPLNAGAIIRISTAQTYYNSSDRSDFTNSILVINPDGTGKIARAIQGSITIKTTPTTTTQNVKHTIYFVPIAVNQTVAG